MKLGNAMNKDKNKEGYVKVKGGRVWYKIYGSGSLAPIIWWYYPL